MTQAVEDGATRPVYYESRVVHLKLDENTLTLIDSTYDIWNSSLMHKRLRKVKKCWGRWKAFLEQIRPLHLFVMIL